MVRRTSLEGALCPVARALDVIGDWWSLLIIRDVFNGLGRFTELHNSLGVAKGILSARLRRLVEQGVLELVPVADGSAYKEYVLTPKGQGLFLVIVSLRQWGEDFLYAPDEPRSALVDIETGERAARLELRTQDGRSLDWHNTAVKMPDASPASTRA